MLGPVLLPQGLHSPLERRRCVGASVALGRGLSKLPQRPEGTMVKDGLVARTQSGKLTTARVRLDRWRAWIAHLRPLLAGGRETT